MSLINFSIFDMVHPYTQVFAGGSKEGPIGRAIVGLEVNPFSTAKILIGGEYSTLGYQRQSRWFRTDKFGVSLGTAVQF